MRQPSRRAIQRSRAAISRVGMVAAVGLLVLVGCDREPAESAKEEETESRSSDKASEESSSPSKDASARGAASESRRGKSPGDETGGSGSSSRRADASSRTARSGGETGSPSPGPGGTSSSDLREGTKRQRELLRRAKEAFLRNRLERAEPRFEKVIGTGPMSGAKASAYIALGQIYVQTDRPARAVDLLEKIPDPGDKIVEVHLVLARAYKALERNDEAIEAYETIVDLQPDYIFVYPKLGALYTKVGEKKRAAEIYLKYENRLESMARAVEDPDDSRAVDRINALDFFSAVDDERARDAIQQALGDPDPRVRAKAAETAATVGLTEAESELESLASDDEVQEVREAATRALKRLRETGAPAPR